MTTLLEQALAERDRLTKVIELLQGKDAKPTPQGKGAPKAHGRKWSEADKLKMSKLIKSRLATKKRKTKTSA